MHVDLSLSDMCLAIKNIQTNGAKLDPELTTKKLNT